MTTELSLDESHLNVPETPSSVIIFSGIGIITFIVIAIIVIISCIVMIVIVKKNQQQRQRYSVEEPNTSSSRLENDGVKHRDSVKDSKSKEKSKNKAKQKSRKKEPLLNKYEVPTQCVVADTSFITTENFNLFVDKKVEVDSVSSSSSVVLELPKREYLKDEEFSKQLSPTVIKPKGNSAAQNEGLQHFSMKNTSQFINEKNFHLFVETKPATDDAVSLNSDYEGAVPELPERGYLEENDIGTAGPVLPTRGYTNDDIRGTDTTYTNQEVSVQQHKHYDTNLNSPTSSRLQVGQSKPTGNREDTSGRDEFTSTKEQTSSFEPDSDSLNDYMPLDPTTLNQRHATLGGHTDQYISLTKEQRRAMAAGIEDEYMSMDPTHADSVLGDVKAGSYMTLTHAHRDDNDDYSYTNVAPGSINLQAAMEAYSLGLKNARDKAEH